MNQQNASSSENLTNLIGGNNQVESSSNLFSWKDQFINQLAGPESSVAIGSQLSTEHLQYLSSHIAQQVKDT